MCVGVVCFEKGKAQTQKPRELTGKGKPQGGGLFRIGRGSGNYPHFHF